jgi:hypothetical protein
LRYGQVVFGRDTDGSTNEEPGTAMLEHDSSSMNGIAFGRRRTEITYQPRSTDAKPGADIAEGSIWDNRASTDLHMDNRMDRAFRAQEAAQNMKHHVLPNGLPKYGRRRYPNTLHPSDLDLLKDF